MFWEVSRESRVNPTEQSDPGTPDVIRLWGEESGRDNGYLLHLTFCPT